jgi:hypothetical protein
VCKRKSEDTPNSLNNLSPLLANKLWPNDLPLVHTRSHHSTRSVEYRLSGGLPAHRSCLACGGFDLVTGILYKVTMIFHFSHANRIGTTAISSAAAVVLASYRQNHAAVAVCKQHTQQQQEQLSWLPLQAAHAATSRAASGGADPLLQQPFCWTCRPRAPPVR